VRDRKAARWSGRDIPQRVPVAGDRSQMRTASSRVLIPAPPLPMLFVLWSSQEPQVRYAMDVIFATKERVRIAPKKPRGGRLRRLRLRGCVWRDRSFMLTFARITAPIVPASRIDAD
jgi:hypothetical protein